MTNFILNSDSYKMSHWEQYPPGTQYVNSYIEARSGEDIVFFGLKFYIEKYLFGLAKYMDVNKAAYFCSKHGVPFNKEGWEKLQKRMEDGLGLPLEIWSVDEGTVMPSGNVLVQVRNTDPEFYWLTSFIETALLRAIWYPTSVATNSRAMKKMMKSFLDQSSDSPSSLSFMLHDFGARGATSDESATYAGAAHLINFMGSDTMEAVQFLDEVYDDGVVGFSVPASEHSTMTSWGKEHEVDACRNMIEKYAKTGAIISVVADSYDIFNCTEHIFGGELKEQVKNLEAIGAKLVVRPDSGDLIETPIKVFELLEAQFGSSKNSKGYRKLPPYLGVLQGDGLNKDTLKALCGSIVSRGIALDNFVFGMGGGLLQNVNRDTYKFAMKCSAIMIDNEWVDVYKDPVTDTVKKSKRGILELYKTNQGYVTVPLNVSIAADATPLLKLRYKDGVSFNEQSFEDIRRLAEI